MTFFLLEYDLENTDVIEFETEQQAREYVVRQCQEPHTTPRGFRLFCGQEITIEETEQ